jgi:hypothetical protein
MNDQFELLRKVCLRVASAETAFDPEAYDANKSRLHGHCGAVSSMLQNIFGGDIMTGKVQGDTHYWNRLPDGVEVDLTSCQFGGDGYTPLVKGRKVKPRMSVQPRFLQFADLVRSKLKEA